MPLAATRPANETKTYTFRTQANGRVFTVQAKTREEALDAAWDRYSHIDGIELVSESA